MILSTNSKTKIFKILMSNTIKKISMPNLSISTMNKSKIDGADISEQWESMPSISNQKPTSWYSGWDQLVWKW
jgi:hypothetical protein